MTATAAHDVGTGDLAAFKRRVDRVVGQHPVVVDNAYTTWFAGGTASRGEVRHLATQFSVFSHLFVEAQLRKVINAGSLDAYRAGKEILLNELGVVFKPSSAARPADGTDPELVSTEGTVDGGRFRFGAAHFEWLLRFGAPLGLGFEELGKRRHGTSSTLFFCDELLRIYGSEDPSTAEGASYAVEHWAAAGFWKQLINGLDAFKARECPELPLAFWTWHDKVEGQHAAHTDDELAEHVRRHGDGIRDVCLLVDDATGAYEAALARGAVSERTPATDEDEHGVIHHAAIRTYGETVHTFLDRRAYRGPFAPQFEASTLRPPAGSAVGLERVDHVVGNVEQGHLDEWVTYYRSVLGFDQLVHFSEEQISTEYSALMSTVVWDGEKVVFPINEPAAGRKKSQIEEYLEYYGSPGVQHIAMRTSDIISAVRALRDRGIRFMEIPPEYYDDAKARMDGIDLPWEPLAELGILVDRDHDGHLLQIFTETVTDRPTVFFEIIQREGARGFGEGNFKALFESIERAQAQRGNL